MRFPIVLSLACLIVAPVAEATEPRLRGVDLEDAQFLIFGSGCPGEWIPFELIQGESKPLDLGCATGDASLQGNRLEITFSPPPTGFLTLWLQASGVAPRLGGTATPLTSRLLHRVYPGAFANTCYSNSPIPSTQVWGDIGGLYPTGEHGNFFAEATVFFLPGDRVNLDFSCQNVGSPIVFELFTLNQGWRRH